MNSDDFKPLNKKLKELRKQHGYSQNTLAETLNISRQTVSYWELGKTQPSLDTLATLCRLYHVSADELLGLETKFTTESLE